MLNAAVLGGRLAVVTIFIATRVGHGLDVQGSYKDGQVQCSNATSNCGAK
jgi:hypothetical protein